MVKFTKGPWRLKRLPPWSGLIVVTGNKKNIAVMADLKTDKKITVEENNANAALIRSSPEMYDLLVKLRMECKDSNSVTEISNLLNKIL